VNRPDVTVGQLRNLTTVELLELDVEYTRRAIALGQPGAASKTHRAIRAALRKS
jgi:hypothetical protein